MRTRWEHTEKDGITRTGGVRDLNTHPLPDSTQDALAAMDLEALTFHWKDGSTMKYYAIEYECLWCPSYDHASDDCPELEADDDIEEPMIGS